MCPWVGPHAPSFWRQLWGLPSRAEYLSPQGVLLPLVYGMTASPLRLELRGLSAGQATPSWTVYRLTCQRLLPWLRVTFAMVPDAAWPGSEQRPLGTAPAAGPVGRLGRPSAPDPWVVGSFLSLGCPTCARVCGVLGHLAPVHRCARWVLCLCVRCPGPLGSCSPVCPLGALLCLCGVLGHLAPVQRCVRSVCCFACAVSCATWLLFTGVPARCVALHVRCPGPLGSCSPVCPLGALPVCAVSWATWLLFTGVPAWRVVLRVRCPGPLGSCSPVCPLGVLFCLCGALGHLAPVHRCARWVLCLCVRCPGPPGSCSPVCPLGALFCLCGVLGHSAPVHRCACSACCVACAVSWATWLLFTGVPARCVACMCGVLGHLVPVHRCARLVRCFACAVSWATWLLFTGVPARCVVLLVRCPGPLGSCSPVCPLGAMLCVCGVLGHLAPVHRCARSERCLCLRCPGPLGSCSSVCPPGVLFCVCDVLGHLAPVHRCARSVCCFACAVSWATWLLFSNVPARCVACVCGVLGHLAPVHRCARLPRCLACAVSWATRLLFTGVCPRRVVLRVWCPGPLGSCSPVCPLCVLCGVGGVLGHLAPVHRFVRSVRCFACAVSWATWLLFTGVPARCVACVCAVLGHLAPVHPCARSVCCFACAVSWATWLLFTGVPARSVALRVQCPGPRGTCSGVCRPGVFFFLCGVLGHLAPVHRCARSVRCMSVRCPGPLGSCSPVCPLGALFCLFDVLGHLAPVHRCARCLCCRERPDRTRRGAPTRGQEARQRGTPPATTKAHGQVPSNNGRRVPQTRRARTTRNEPRHRNRCHATPAALRTDVCAPGSEPSLCRLRNSRRPGGRVCARRVPSPCRLRTAAVRTDECAPGRYPAPAGYEWPLSGWTSERPRSDAPHTQPTAQHTERAHR